MLRLLRLAARWGPPTPPASPGDPASVPRAVGEASAAPILRCRRSGGSRSLGGVRVGCVADVPAETLAAAALGAPDGDVLRVATGACATCPDGAADTVATTVEAARRLVEGRHRELVREEAGGPQTLSRRELLAPWRRSPARADVVPEPRPRRDAPVRRHDGKRTPPPSRSVLLAAFGADQPGGLPRPVLTGACTLCGGCAPSCPTGALAFRVEDGRTAVLEADPLGCIDCGDCVRACPEGSLTIAATGPVQPGTVELAVADVAGCARCGRPLAPGEVAACTACRTRRDLASAVGTYGRPTS